MELLNSKIFLIVLPLLTTCSSDDCMQTPKEVLRISDHSKEDEIIPVIHFGNADSKTFEIVDRNNGIVLVNLPDWIVNDSPLFIKLLVFDTEDEENCTANTGDFFIHTEKNISIDNEKRKKMCNGILKIQNCTVNYIVKFNYVYSGCYKIQFEDQHNSQTKPEILHTNYKKYPLNKLSLNYVPKLSKQDKNYTMTFIFRSNSSNMNEMQSILRPKEMIIQMWQKNNRSNSIDCKVYDSNKQFSDRCNICSILSEKYITSGFGIGCIFSDMNPENYCAVVRLFDVRCKKKEKYAWAKDFNYTESSLPCSWKVSIVVEGIFNEPEKSITIDENTTNTRPWLYLGYFLIFNLIIFIIVAVKMFSKSELEIPTPQPDGAPAIINIMNKPSSKVLLLYPRDCQELMAAMAKLRNVLEKRNCQVFDCFDSSLYLEISLDPCWMRKQISNKSTKVVVVASDCARRLEQNIGNQEMKDICPYRDPQCLDGLFVYGLNCLECITTHSPNSGDFHVIRLEDSFEEGAGAVNGLRHLDQHEIFHLPENLDKLILALHNHYATNRTGLENTTEVNEFKDAVEKYRKYRKDNENYLNDILNF